MACMVDRKPRMAGVDSGTPLTGRGNQLKNILIVDDYEPSLWVLSQILASIANNIERALNGKEALDLIKVLGRQFDIILSDVNMPVMDGLTFFREAVLYDPDLSSRFLFFTGALNPDLERFFKRNNLNYLEKPAGADRILDAVVRAGQDSMVLESTS